MKNKMISQVLLFALACSTAFGQTFPVKKAGSKKVVFIAGTDSHGKGEHEHNAGSILLARRLNDSSTGIQATVCENGWPKDESVLRDVDAIVIYADGGGDHMLIPHIAKIDSLLKKGVGVTMIHFALEIPKGTTGDHFLNWVGGYFETDWSVNPVWKAQVTTLPDHPITNGVEPFEIQDEWYYHMRFTANTSQITPILKVLPPDSTLNRPDGTHSGNRFVRQEVLTEKKPQTLAWAYVRSEGGRSFGFTGGHIHKNWGNDNFRMLVLNAIAWTAKAEIPANGIISLTPANSELDSLSKRLE